MVLTFEFLGLCNSSGWRCSRVFVNGRGLLEFERACVDIAFAIVFRAVAIVSLASPLLDVLLDTDAIRQVDWPGGT